MYHFGVRDVRCTDEYHWLTEHVGMPLLRGLDAEDAHGWGLRLAAAGLGPREDEEDDPVLATELVGLHLSNPVGLAAGFDKHGEAMEGMLACGLGAVEVGTVTPKEQPGNSRPRMFRLEEDRAVINRFGFNSEGLSVVVPRVEAFLRRRAEQPRSLPRVGAVGLNIGKNKTAEALPDYVAGVRAAAPVADYLTVNISSPNTPGLRALQRRETMQGLLEAVVRERDAIDWQALDRRPCPVLVKVAPDLSAEEVVDVCEASVAAGVQGLIVSNTTVARPSSLQGARKGETGGLSGRPLKEPSLEILRQASRVLDGRLPLVGVGGIESGQDAYAKIRAGASAVQVYTALGYCGPALVRRIKRELAGLVKEDGFGSVGEAVGADRRSEQGEQGDNGQRAGGRQ